jgi:hypothetical protein
MKGAAASLGGTRVSQLALRISLAVKQGRMDEAREVFQSFQPEYARLNQALARVDWEAVASAHARSQAAK